MNSFYPFLARCLCSLHRPNLSTEWSTSSAFLYHMRREWRLSPWLSFTDSCQVTLYYISVSEWSSLISFLGYISPTFSSCVGAPHPSFLCVLLNGELIYGSLTSHHLSPVWSPLQSFFWIGTCSWQSISKFKGADEFPVECITSPPPALRVSCFRESSHRPFRYSRPNPGRD